MIVYLNGRWLDRREAAIPIDDRGLLLADGVFETGRLHRGRYFRLDQHLARFENSAHQLRLQAPDREQLVQIAEQLRERNRLDDGSLRITLTRGPGGKGLDTRGTGPQMLLVTLSPIAADWRERAAQGWRLMTAQTRRPPTSAVPAQLKALGRVYALLARLEAESSAVDDALLLSSDGFVAEGPSWNFFWRTGARLRTASLEAGVLEGTTRAVIADLARTAGFTVEEGLWPVSDVLACEEAFATMTSVGVVPIRSLDDYGFESTDCATLLQSRYWEFVDADSA